MEHILYGFRIITDSFSKYLSIIPPIKDSGEEYPKIYIGSGIQKGYQSIFTKSARMLFTDFSRTYIYDDKCDSYSFEGDFVHTEEGCITVKSHRYDYLDVALTLGITMIAPIYNRVILHGASFIYRKKAYVLLAPGGTGKSTFITALCMNHNVMLINDDISMLSDDDSLYVGLPRIRLNADSAAILKPEERFQTDFSNVSDKDVFYPKYLTEYCPEYPLGGIFILSPKNDENIINISKLSNLEAFIFLTANIKCQNSMLSETIQNFMLKLRKLVDNVNCYKISYQKQYSLLNEQTEKLLLFMESRI